MTLVLQPPVSRVDSVLFQISDLAWHNGLQPIFLYGIPFSGRSNLLSAKRHAILISEVYKTITPTPETVSILEMGACHGILTSQLLAELSAHYPDIYDKLRLTLCDYSPHVIALLKSNPLLRAHEEKIEFLLYSELIKPSENKNSNLHFHYIYHSYLYNAFPCKHISVTSTGLKEVVIETQIPEDVTLYEIETLTELSASALKDLFQTSPQDTLKKYGRFLAPWLIEIRHEVPLAGRLSDDLVKKLSAFVHDNNFQGTFNFSEESITVMTQLQTMLIEGGMYCFSDVSLHKKKEEIAPLSTTSHCHFYPIVPKLISEFTSTKNSCLYKDFENDCLVDFMITSKSFVDRYATLFEQTFSTTGLAPLQTFSQALERTAPEAFLQDDFLKLTDQVDDTLQTDYFFLQKSMNYAMGRNWDELAFFIAELMITHYSDYAFDAYKALSVLAMKSQPEPPPQEIRHFLEHVIYYLPEDSAAYQLLSHYYVLKKDNALAIDYLKQAFPIIVKAKKLPEFTQEVALQMICNLDY